MNKSWFYLGAIGMAIVLTSCGDSKPAPTPSPSTAAPVAAPTAAAPATTAPAAAPIVPALVAAAPTVPGKPVSVNSAGLIPATNGDNWAKTVNKGNADPFATLALQPVEAVEKDAITGLPVAKSTVKIASNTPVIRSGVNKPLPGIKVASNPTQTRVPGKSKVASKGSTSVDTGITRDGDTPISAIPRTGVNKTSPKIAVGIKPSNSSKPPTVAKAGNKNVLRPVNVGATPGNKPGGTQIIAARPERAAEKPLQAMALEISGVIEVEGKTQVIVKLPNESFSRYIDVGSRVANGNILVKRVEGQDSVSPTVVLEEVGVEISRKIGDKAIASEPVAQPK